MRYLLLILLFLMVLETPAEPLYYKRVRRNKAKYQDMAAYVLRKYYADWNGHYIEFDSIKDDTLKRFCRKFRINTIDLRGYWLLYADSSFKDSTVAFDRDHIFAGVYTAYIDLKAIKVEISKKNLKCIDKGLYLRNRNLLW